MTIIMHYWSGSRQRTRGRQGIMHDTPSSVLLSKPGGKSEIKQKPTDDMSDGQNQSYRVLRNHFHNQRKWWRIVMKMMRMTRKRRWTVAL